MFSPASTAAIRCAGTVIESRTIWQHHSSNGQRRRTEVLLSKQLEDLISSNDCCTMRAVQSRWRE
jgi:hypothetical protein